MFKLSTNSTFKRDVTVYIPTDDGETKGAFKAHFKRLPQSRIDEVLESMADDDSDKGLLDEILIGVEGIADSDGNPLPNDADTLQLVKDDSCARVATVSTYFKAIQRKNQRKN